MKKIACLVSIYCIFGANFAYAEPAIAHLTDPGVTVALICDSEESCDHLAGVIKGSNDNNPVTVALICGSEEECAHLSGIITNQSPRMEIKYRALPLKVFHQ